MLGARATDKRVEDLSARTPTSATFANPNGTWTTEAFTGAVRSKADDNKWVAADSDLERTGAAYEPKAVPYEAKFSDGGSTRIGSATLPGGEEVTVGWPRELPRPVADGAELTYPSVVPNGDLVVTSETTGFNYSVVLDKAPAADDPQVEFRFPLKFKGLKADFNEDGSAVLKAGGRRVAELTAPVMWDASSRSEDLELESNAAPHPVKASIEGEGPARTLVLRPDMKYLTSSDTTYPVTIDPTLVINVGGDTWVQSTGDTSSQNLSPELRVGSNNGGATVARSYMQFDLSSFTALPAATVQFAGLSLSNFESGSCTGNDIRVSRITSGWTIPSVTWATQPTVTSSNSAVTAGAFGASGCTAEGSMMFDMTAMVNDWLGGTWNPGIQIKADNETAAAGFRRVRSLENGDLAKAPKLSITYNSYPSRASGLTSAPGTTYGSTNYVTSSTPTLSAVVGDPDGGAVRGYFEVRDSSDTTTLWSGSSAWATSGATVSATVPSGVLTHGTTYKFRAFSQDAYLKSQTPIYRTVVVDTSAPATVITATNYTNNVWATTMPASNTFKFDGPTDTAVFDTDLDGVRSTIGANASGDFSFPYTYVAEWHSFKVTAVDKAGNRGPTATFSFGSAAPGFSLPRQNAVSTSAFPLDISAQPTSTGAAVSWRLQGETTWRSATQVTKAGASWTGAVTTSGGRSTTGTLLWRAANETYGTGTLGAPAIIQLRACFHYASAADKCTYSRTLQLVPSAFGGNFPTAEVGPATVALHTGEASIDTTDAPDGRTGVGRSFLSFDAATVDAGVFGPGWSDPTILAAGQDGTADIVDNRTRDGSFVVVDRGGQTQAFVAQSGSTTNYVPFDPSGDATALVYTAPAGGLPAKLELTRPAPAGSVKTTWTLKSSDTGGAPAWTVDSVDSPGTYSDVTVTSTAQRPTFVRLSEPSAATTCTVSTQTLGCRALKISYTGTGTATRVSSIARVIGATTPGAVTITTLVTYAYDGSNRLASACTPAPAAGKPALCSAYAYTVVAGRTVLSELQAAGLKKFRFTYDASGRLQSAKRERPTGGDATWTVDYGASITGSGMPDLSGSTAAQWGQSTLPTKVVAVYDPYNGAASVTKADLFYTTDDGAVTNQAHYGPSGWILDANWYDAKGNVVQYLDNTGWSLAQAAPPTERPRVAAEASTFYTYNTWGGASVAGTRLVDEWGPASTSTRKDGTVGLFRVHTRTTYDDDPSVDASLVSDRPSSTGVGLVVRETTSTAEAARTADYDSVVTDYRFGPIVSGDGNGWTIGAPTRVLTKSGSTTLSEAVTRFDLNGREVESRRPGGTADGTGAGNDAASTKTVYYTASGSGDCGGKPAWDGLVCKVGPAAQPGGTTIPTTYYSAYDDAQQATTTLEVSGGVTNRTTVVSYDNIGRTTGSVVTTGGAGVTAGTTTTTLSYDDSTGLTTGISRSGSHVAVGYDSWGRRTSYTDASGVATATTFDDAGNVATRSDGVGTYSYSYDAASGNVVSVNTGGAGVFDLTYTAGNQLASVSYPNGVVGERSYDESGQQTGLSYRQGTTPMIGFSNVLGSDGLVRAQASSQSTQQLTYDDLGRLTKAEDVRENGCATRTYAYNASSNRTGTTGFAPGVGGACQTTSPATTKSTSFDSAGRATSSGYGYDTLGQTLTLPQADSGPTAAGAMSLIYRPSGRVSSTSQSLFNSSGGTDSRSTQYEDDPADRTRRITETTNGAETRRLEYRYASESDSPGVIRSSVDGGGTWETTRNVSVPFLGFAAEVGSSGTVLQVVNMHGDIVGVMDSTLGTAVVSTYSEHDEFGNRVSGSPGRYGWLGAFQRATDSANGTIQMGDRIYNPSTGLFTGSDPQANGNRTPYGYPEDPVASSDLDGHAATNLPTPGGGGSGDPTKAGCKTKSWTQKYKEPTYITAYWIDITLKWCWTSGWEPRVRNITASVDIGANWTYDVQNAKGPTNKDKLPITSRYVSKPFRTTVYFWFQSRNCVPNPFGFNVCTGWSWHRLVYRIYAGGKMETVSRS